MDFGYRLSFHSLLSSFLLAEHAFREPRPEFRWSRHDEKKMEGDRLETPVIAQSTYESGTIPMLTTDGIAIQSIPQDCFTKLVEVVRRHKKRGLQREQPMENLLNSGPGHAQSYILEIPNRLATMLKKRITPIMEEWVGRKLKYSNQYGVRCYANGSVLLRHVDNPDQLASAILNVVSEVAKPWPLMIEAHEPGSRRSVALEAGKMLLYESYRLPHWRPEPLDGWVCNLFMHWTLPADEWDSKKAIKAEVKRTRTWMKRRMSSRDQDERLVWFASKYKSGTQLAAHMVGTLTQGMLDFSQECLEHKSLDGCNPPPKLSEYKVIHTKEHQKTMSNMELVQVLQKDPRHTGVFFFRDPVEMLAAAYLHSRNASECKLRNRLYTDDECDLVLGIDPKRWKTVEDGLNDLKGNSKSNPLNGNRPGQMYEVISGMHEALTMLQDLPNAIVVWMDEVLPGHTGLHRNLLFKIFLFASSRAMWQPPDSWLHKLVEQVANKIAISMGPHVATGAHMLEADDLEYIVTKIHEMAPGDEHIRYYIDMRRKWQGLRVAGGRRGTVPKQKSEHRETEKRKDKWKRKWQRKRKKRPRKTQRPQRKGKLKWKRRRNEKSKKSRRWHRAEL